MRAAAYLVLALSCAALPVRASDRPALVEEVEKRSNEHFIFTTAGEGVYTLYERLDAAPGFSPEREIVCLMQRCYVALGRVAAIGLERAREPGGQSRGVWERFQATRRALEGFLAAPRPDKAAAERSWMEEVARLEACLGPQRAC